MVEAVALVCDQGFSVSKVPVLLGIASNMLYRWKGEIVSNTEGKSLLSDEREKLNRPRKKVKNLRMEKEILKNHLRAHTSHRIETRVQLH
jgi:transposase